MRNHIKGEKLILFLLYIANPLVILYVPLAKAEHENEYNNTKFNIINVANTNEGKFY